MLPVKVPEFKILSRDIAKDLREFHAQGLFESGNFFLKNLNLERDDRLDFTRIPSTNDDIEKYIMNHLKNKNNRRITYFINEFIDGEEFGANIACKDGKIFMMQVFVR